MPGGGAYSFSSAASTCFKRCDELPLVCENPFEIGFMEVDSTPCVPTPFDLVS